MYNVFMLVGTPISWCVSITLNPINTRSTISTRQTSVHKMTSTGGNDDDISKRTKMMMLQQNLTSSLFSFPENDRGMRLCHTWRFHGEDDAFDLDLNMPTCQLVSSFSHHTKQRHILCKSRSATRTFYKKTIKLTTTIIHHG